MGGNSGDSGSSLGSTGGASSQVVEGGDTSLLGGVSEAELDAFVSKLRTDKNRVMPAEAQSRGRRDMMSERLHAGRRSLVSSMAEEAAPPAWYVAMAGKVSGPHDVAALKAHWEKGELGPDSLCWRDGFDAWLPLCQVPELAEALVPLPQEKLPTLVESSTSTPVFALKGAEALHSLSASAAPVPAAVVEPRGAEASQALSASAAPVTARRWSPFRWLPSRRPWRCPPRGWRPPWTPWEPMRCWSPCWRRGRWRCGGAAACGSRCWVEWLAGCRSPSSWRCWAARVGVRSCRA
ncbi:GYF domain-containing protein [Pyxidicoccus sp. 3LG]